MLITVITLFPQVFEPLLSTSLIKRAKERKLVRFELVNLRTFGIGKHKIVDDKPYGGGVGMILRVDVLCHAIDSVRKKGKKEAVILLDPKGEVYSQKKAESLSKLKHLILVCGHYEGFDERVRALVDYEVSIGDYILSGGEIPAMAVIDSVARLIPGALKKEEAINFESFAKIGGKRMLEYPQWTRPLIFHSKRVPAVLLSGNFKQIEKYKLEKAQELTKHRRPDLKY